MADFDFVGGPVQTLDAKGRLVVPARFKAELQEKCAGRMVVTRGVERCLQVWPMPVWDDFVAGLKLLPPSAQLARRRFLGTALHVEIDSGGRIQLTQELRDWARLNRDVVFMGLGDRFELWDRAAHDALDEALTADDLHAWMDAAASALAAQRSTAATEPAAPTTPRAAKDGA